MIRDTKKKLLNLSIPNNKIKIKIVRNMWLLGGILKLLSEMIIFYHFFFFNLIKINCIVLI